MLRIIICALIIFMSGCSTIKEAAKGFAGVSTRALENGRKDAIKKTFNLDYKTCYGKVKSILAVSGSYIYAEDKAKKMIAIYISETDTTPVGVFFKEIDSMNVQVEVSSASTYARELISKRIFSGLEPEKKEGQ